MVFRNCFKCYSASLVKCTWKKFSHLYTTTTHIELTYSLFHYSDYIYNSAIWNEETEATTTKKIILIRTTQKSYIEVWALYRMCCGRKGRKGGKILETIHKLHWLGKSSRVWEGSHDLCHFMLALPPHIYLFCRVLKRYTHTHTHRFFERMCVYMFVMLWFSVVCFGTNLLHEKIQRYIYRWLEDL